MRIVSGLILSDRSSPRGLELLIAQLVERKTVVVFVCYLKVAGSIPAQQSSFLMSFDELKKETVFESD